MTDAYLYAGDIEKAIEYCNDSIRLASLYNHREILASAYFSLGQIHAHKQNWYDAERYIYNSIELAVRLNIKRQQGKGHYLLGKIFLKQNKIDDSILNYKTSISIFRSIDARCELRKVRDDLKYAMQQKQ